MTIRVCRCSATKTVRLVSKGFTVPEGGWTARTFRQHGAALIAAIAYNAKLTQRRAIPVIAKAASDLFNDQVREVISRVTRKAASIRGAKAETQFTFEFAQQEELWAEAMREVFARNAIAATVKLTPSIQSVMAQGYSRTNIMLGQPGAGDRNAELARKARAIAERVTRVNETTRKQLADTIRDAISNGLSVTETAEAVLKRMPRLNAVRSMTIARTESNRAWTEGSAESFKESGGVTEMSVIGCEAREPSSPEFNGESTCNYEGIKMHELDAFLAVGFHPNHTGTLVPSAFAEDATDAGPKPEVPDPVDDSEKKLALSRMESFVRGDDPSKLDNPLMHTASMIAPKRWPAELDALKPEAMTALITGQTETFKLDALTLQSGKLLSRAKVEAFIENPTLARTAKEAVERLPVVARVQDDASGKVRHYLVDGHARAAALSLRGKAEIQVQVIDVKADYVERLTKKADTDARRDFGTTVGNRYVAALKAMPNTMRGIKADHVLEDLRPGNIALRDAGISHYSNSDHAVRMNPSYSQEEFNIVYQHEHAHAIEKHFKVHEDGELLALINRLGSAKLPPELNSTDFFELRKNLTGLDISTPHDAVPLKDRWNLVNFTDTLKALTESRAGWGHDAEYFKSNHSRVSEVWAHAVNTVTTRNPLIEKYFPELAEFARRRLKLEP